jgi:hypothetical protein
MSLNQRGFATKKWPLSFGPSVSLQTKGTGKIEKSREQEQ